MATPPDRADAEHFHHCLLKLHLDGAAVILATQSVVQGPTASVSPDVMLVRTWNLRSHPGPEESEIKV